MEAEGAEAAAEAFVVAVVVAVEGREAKAFVSESSSGTGGAAGTAAAAAVFFSTAAGTAEGATTTVAGATAAKLPLPPLPSGVGEVTLSPPLLPLPAPPGFSRPMNEEVARGDVEVVVVSSWER